MSKLALERRLRRDLFATPARFLPISRGRLDIKSLFENPLDKHLIFEIGSSDGQDTLRMLEEFPRATVHCFEIDERAVKEWQMTIREPRAQLHLSLVGKSSGVTDFYESYGTPPGALASEYPEGWHFSGSTRRPLEHTEKYPWVKFRKRRRLPVVTLDDFCKSNEISPDIEIGLIWMDVQGAEGDVLAGAARTIAQTRFVYAEYSTRELYEGQPTLKRLCELLPGFKIAKIWPDDVLFENQFLVNRLTQG